MTRRLIDPDAPAKVLAAISAGILKARGWGDGVSAVCAMSAMVPGAVGVEDCVTAGWPEWLAELVVYLYDGAPEADRAPFALAVAKAVSSPRDYDRARDLFLIQRLDTGDHSALASLRRLSGDWTCQIEAVSDVVALLRRRLAGEDVRKAMTDAWAAAEAAAQAGAVTAARAAEAGAGRAARRDLIAALEDA